VSAPTIVFEGASKWYGDVLGLNEVTASFGPGVTGLLGPNGAGKSTLLKLACGMLRPSLGRVLLAGEPPFGNAALMRRVGLCPEQDAVYPRTPVLEVLTYLTRLHGYPRREAQTRARAALERVGLASVLERSAVGFSKGMRQRLKLAQALAHDPDVLVLDEPLNGLDPPGRREVGGMIRALGEEGRLVLVSSHVLHEVESLAPRVLFLAVGRVLAEGSVAAIRSELPDRPLTVRLTTPTPDALAGRLVGLDGVRSIAWAPAGLEVTTARPDALFDRVADVPPEIVIDAVEPTDEDLEAVFRYLNR